MTILSVARDVSAVVGVTVPTSIFSNLASDRTMQEMLALANEMAQRIAYDTRDWTALRVVATHTGNGTQTAFDLPANFRRMLLTGNVWKTNFNQTPMRFVPDTDQWLNRRAKGTTDGTGEWTILGRQIHVYPVIPAGHTFYYTHMDRNCVALNGGGFSETFLNDGDRYVLDERILKLGMIWQWKASHGSSYSEDMGTYADALMIAMGTDAPAPIIYGRGDLHGRASYGGPGPWPL